MATTETHFVIHYSEIAIKGGNREFFESKLIQNLKERLEEFDVKVEKRYGKILLQTPEKNNEEIKKILSLFPGIECFAEIKIAKLDLEDIKKTTLEICKEKEFSSFKVSAKRSFKKFPANSDKINHEVGAYIVEKLKKKVQMKNPGLEIYIEIGEKEALLFSEKIKGVGGLPVGTSGKLVCLLSGGIDSPVSAFMMMKRGAKIILCHFFNKTINAEASLGKVKELAQTLSKYQMETKLWVVPFSNLQKQIIMNVPSKCRMIIYRRIMCHIANKIAEKENAKGILTGDSLAQVASQTLDNLMCIYNSSKLLVYSPLIGQNKIETIELANKIGTYKTSILPYNDCCSFMNAPHPEINANLQDILEIEKNVENLDALEKEAVQKIEIYKYKNGKVV